ncbi:unnamed protein product, partial [Durusdinium trenchii]
MKRPCAKKHLKKPAATTRWKCKASLSRSSLDRDGVKEEIRKWASQVSGQLIDIRLSQHDNRPDHYRYTWNCASCLNCNFRGVGTYDVTSEVLELIATDADKHTMDRVYGGRKDSLLAGHKMFIQEYLGQNTSYRMQQLVEMLREKFPDLEVTDKLETKLKTYIDNWKKRHRQDARVAKREDWVTADFQCLVRELPALEDAVVTDELVLVDHRIDEQLCLVFACPKLVQETAKRVANWQWLKVCADGTYRMVKGDYVVVSAGFLSKTFGRHAHPGEPEEGFTTQFNELVLAIAHKENTEVYSLLFSALVNVVAQFGE